MVFQNKILLKWLTRQQGERCPDCGTPRQEDEPLCTACGWVYEVPGEDEDDYGEPEEEEEPWR